MLMNITDKNMLIERYVVGRESALIKQFIADGPTKMRVGLGLDDAQWLVIFDHLVFQHNLPFKVIIKNIDFFSDLYVKHGLANVREVLDVVDEKYDVMVELVFDFLAIAHGGLIYHVVEHRDKYVEAMWEHGGDFVRNVLYISADKYEESWAKVLDILLHATCEDICDKYAFENALRAFSGMANSMREHRRIGEGGIL